MRASMDWPHCPTTTRSSIWPRRRGPKMCSHGGGKERLALRNVVGTGAHDDAAPEPFRERPGAFRSGSAGRRTAIVKYLLSQRAVACHDISQKDECKHAESKRFCRRNKLHKGAFLFGWRGLGWARLASCACVTWLGVIRRE